MPSHEWQTPSLHLRLEDDVLTVRDRKRNQRLIVTPLVGLLAPVWERHSLAAAPTGVTAEEETLTIDYPAYRVTLTVDAAADVLDLRCAFTAPTVGQLNALGLLPPETLITAYDLVNYRNRHHTPRTWPELLLGGPGFATDTYSTDWQFAPHPPAWIFRKAGIDVLTGMVEVDRDYGMYMGIESNHVRHWYLDYGSFPHGLVMAPGDEYESPRFRIMLRHDHSVDDLWENWADLLIAQSVIPDPASFGEQDWAMAPLYCTWTDQGLASRADVAFALEAQAAGAAPAVAILDADFCRRAAAVIKRENLPFRTFLIDDGWQVSRGQWEADPQKFPDLRGLVDELHADGFKVVIWWNWAEIYDDAEVERRHLAAGGRRNRHGRRMRDYSRRSTQAEYLKPLMRQLFSSDPGCYDFDGAKSDFLPDKIHPELPPADPAWRGETNYWLRLTRLWYTEMKRHKPDAIHIGGNGNFYLAPWIDINRTYDVHSSDWREHEERARMLVNLTPGTPVAYDFHGVLENLRDYFASARRHDCAVEIGNVLYVREDLWTDPRPADEAYYELLRRELRP